MSDTPTSADIAACVAGLTLSPIGYEAPERAPIRRTGQRDPISPLVRQLVYRRDRWTCQRCGKRSWGRDPERRSGPLHLDHITPWSAGGSDRSDNLRTLCGPCNMDRSNFVSKSDRASIPIVRICAPCLACVDRRIELLCEKDLPNFDVYCGSHSGPSWALVGWHIL